MYRTTHNQQYNPFRSTDVRRLGHADFYIERYLLPGKGYTVRTERRRAKCKPLLGGGFSGPRLSRRAGTNRCGRGSRSTRSSRLMGARIAPRFSSFTAPGIRLLDMRIRPESRRMQTACRFLCEAQVRYENRGHFVFQRRCGSRRRRQVL